MNRSGFEQLALEHLDAVYRMAFHLTRRPDEAEELVQEVYVRAFRPSSIANFESKGGGMRAWLFAICHNTHFTRLKQAARRPAAVGEFFAESDDGPAPGEPPPAWDRRHLDWEHVDARLRDAIDDLKPEYREVLMMWAIDGLKYREIGEILGVPIGTVMSRLHRARKSIADTLSTDPDAVAELGIARPGKGAGDE